MPKYKITDNTDSVLTNLTYKKIDLLKRVSNIMDTVLHTNLESESFSNFFQSIKNGKSELVTGLIQTDSVVIKVVKRNDLSPVQLFNLAKEISELNSQITWYNNINCIKKKRKRKCNTATQKAIRKELRKYKLKNGDKILEIGSGNIEFAKAVVKKIKNSDIYINDIKSRALGLIYLALQYDEKNLKRYIRKRHNKIYLIKGTEKSTGAENIIFDKIIIRNALHCFTEKEHMLESIKKSMDKNTILIIKEKFETKKDLPLPHYMFQNNFEKLMMDNGFTRIYSKKIKSSTSVVSWIYKFTKQDNNSYHDKQKQ